MYLNGDELREMFSQLVRVCGQSSLICIREPIVIKERLTLKNFYSDELNYNYNAIYRRRDEIMQIIDETLTNRGGWGIR